MRFGARCNPVQPLFSINKAYNACVVFYLVCYKENCSSHMPNTHVLLLINGCKRKQHNRRHIWSHMESELSLKDSVLDCAFVTNYTRKTALVFNTRQKLLSISVISQCYNSLWPDTITLWTRGQRWDLGVIYCDLSPAGQSPMYANHFGLTLSVPFKIYCNQWGWNFFL